MSLRGLGWGLFSALHLDSLLVLAVEGEGREVPALCSCSWSASSCRCRLPRALWSGCHSHCPGARWGSLSPIPSMYQAPERILAEHYHDLQRKPFYPALISYMSSGPVVAMVQQGCGSGRVEGPGLSPG